MKKFITLLLVLCFTPVFGCSEKQPIIYDGGPNHTLPPTITTTTQGVYQESYPDEYVDSDRLMFSVSCTNEGPFNWGFDYWKNTEYRLYYNGRLEITDIYSLSGSTKTETTISKEEFGSLRRLLQKVRIEEPYRDRDYSGYCDGIMWGFDYYGLHGEHKHLYSGYTDGITELEEIEEALSGHAVKQTLADRAYAIFEGYYVNPSDNALYLNIYKNEEGKILADTSFLIEGKPEKDTIELTNIQLNEKYVSFEYVKDRKNKSLVFKYSADNNTLTEYEGETVYVRQSQSA